MMMEMEEEELFHLDFNPDSIGEPLRKPRTTAPLTRDTGRWMKSKPQQCTYMHGSASPRGCNVDALVRSSNLSASAPEFVPSGFCHYESSAISNFWGACLGNNTSHRVACSPPSGNIHQPLKSVGDEDTEPCAEEDPPVWDQWDPSLEVFIASEQESLPCSGSTSDQGSLRDQALDAVDFQPNLDLPAHLDKLKVGVTHVNSPGSFYVQPPQNNVHLKSVGDEDTEPCAEEDPPVWDQWDPSLEVFIASEQESLPCSGSTSDQGSLRDQALDAVDFQPNLDLPAHLDKLKVGVTHVNSPGSFYVQPPRNNVQLKSVDAKDTEPFSEDPALWDPPLELKSFGAKEPCAEEDPTLWDPTLGPFIASDQESLPSSGSTSDQGSLRDQALDAVDFQPNLDLPAHLDKLKVGVTHVNSPGSFYVQPPQNNVQLKSVDAKDTEPFAEDPALWDPPLELKSFGAKEPCAEEDPTLWDPESLPSSGSTSDQGSLRDQALDAVYFQPDLALPACLDKLKVRVTHGNSPRNFHVQLTHNHFQSVRAKDTKPCAEDTALWDPLLEVLIPSEEESLCGSSSVSDQEDKDTEPCAEGPPVWDPPLEVFIGSLRDQALDAVDFQPNLELPACLDKLKVKVTHVNSPGSFYVQLTQNNMQLKRLQEMLKQEYGSMEPQDVQWEAGMYCAVLINGLWERGLICNTASTNMAEVRRCDFGNRVFVHFSNLRPLQDVLVGSLALECALSDISPAGGVSTWTATACELIIRHLTGAMATMTIKELTEQRPLPVSLFYANQTGKYVCVADFLVGQGLALKERVMTTLYQPPELPCHGDIRMSVSAVGDDGVIYARTDRAEHQLEQLNDRTQQLMKRLPSQKPYDWRCVQGCSVMGPDMHWHRGQVLEVISRNVKVRYVDSGHVENIPVVHVYPMLLCEEVPQLCIPCQLHGLIPVGRKWQVDAVALLRNLLVGRVLDMQVMELPLEERGCVTVQIFLDGLNLSRIMRHHQHASLDTTVALQEEEHVNTCTESDFSLDEWDIDTKGLEMPNEPVGAFSFPSLPEDGERFRVTVKHVHTPNEVYLVPGEEAGPVLVNEGEETLEEAIDRINTDIDSLPLLSNYPLGGACLAEYSDGRYYRARMMEFVGVNPPALLVQHVDFGSDDIMLTWKLRQMPAELLRFPATALKVRLCGFKPPKVNQETEMLPYSPEWSVKATQEMIKLLHGKITASIVVREPELTVLLYNEQGELVHLPLVRRRLAAGTWYL